MEKEKNFISVVVYVYNAEKRLGTFLSQIIDVLERKFEHSEIICVNDASSDNSSDVIKRVCRKATTTSVSVVNMSYFHGLELSMKAGVDLSIGDFVFEFDNTILDFDPNVIVQVYKHLLEGYDIVSASADKNERWTSRFFYRIFNHYSDRHYKLATESFRLLSRRAINRISSMTKSVPYRKALYSNVGLKTDNVKYKPTESCSVEFDKKEIRFRTGLAIDSLILFTDMGYSFSKTMTAIMMVISLFMVMYSIIVYLTSNPVAGWTTTVLFLSVAFFGLFGILTVIIKYLQLLVDLVFKRKNYMYEDIEKITD